MTKIAQIGLGGKAMMMNDELVGGRTNPFSKICSSKWESSPNDDDGHDDGGGGGDGDGDDDE